MLKQCTHNKVASSRSSTPRNGPSWWTHSVLESPITDSPMALSQESPTMPIEAKRAGVGEAFGVADRGGATTS